MGSLFEDIRDGIRDGIEFVADKTDEYTKIGKLKVEILSVKRNIEKLFSELGGRTYELLSEKGTKNVSGDDEVKRLVAEIEELEKNLDGKKDQIKDIRDNKEKQRKEREEAKQSKAEKTDDVEDAHIVEETEDEDKESK